MYLVLQAINEDATLNNFSSIGVIKFIKDQALTMVLRINQPTKALRYIPETGSTASITLKKSDNTTITISGSFPFADDRSIIKFSMTALEMANVISQPIIVTLTEPTAGISTALLENGLQIVKLDGC